MKFLRKSGVLKDCWVDDEDMGLVALEISLLARLHHPNIVMVCTCVHVYVHLHDVYYNIHMYMYTVV